MTEAPLEYRTIVLTERLRLPGVLDSMTDQTPELHRVIEKISTRLAHEIESLNGGGWTVNSHSVTSLNGLFVASFLMCRPQPNGSGPAKPAA